MNIVLASGVLDDPQNSIHYVQSSLRREFIARGHHAACMYQNDVGIRIKRLIELEFSLKAAFAPIFDDADVIDMKVGDGLFTTLRRRVFKRKAPQLLVARSHGLDHINFNVKKTYLEAQGKRMTWRERLYAGRYLLWQVHTHMRLADVCLFLNHEEHDYATDKLGIDPQKCFIIDNGIPNYLIGLPPRAPSESTASLRVAVIGTYTLRKLNVAPKAIASLLARHPRMTFGFLGTMVDDEHVFGDYDARDHSRISNVKRYQHESLPALLADFDVLFFPTMADGFGMVVFEAMACGLGVIASDIPSLRSRLDADRNVVFFERLDVEAMVRAIERVVDDPALLTTLQREGHLRTQQMSWESVANRTLEIFTTKKSDLKRKRTGAYRR